MRPKIAASVPSGTKLLRKLSDLEIDKSVPALTSVFAHHRLRSMRECDVNDAYADVIV